MSHVRNFTNQFNCGNITSFNKLPLIYMVPKFHKDPIQFRFIVASKKCSTTPLSSAIGKALSEILKQRKFYCAKLERYDGINRYWVIESNQAVLNCIDSLNSTKSSQSVTTYDFSNLYTALPHDEILQCVLEMIGEVFKYRNKKNFKFINQIKIIRFGVVPAGSVNLDPTRFILITNRLKMQYNFN